VPALPPPSHARYGRFPLHPLRRAAELAQRLRMSYLAPVPWFYSKIYDRFMRDAERAGLAAWRSELVAPLTGDVLEIGAGTGANLEHYGTGVERLVLCEPDRHMHGRLLQRAASSSAEVIEAPSEVLPFPDESFDAVVCTLVLCSVPDPDRSLREARRVLRPEGRLVFIEHVAAQDRPARLRWQERIEPFWVRMADGCHLTRRTDQSIVRAGFELETLTRASMRKALPFVRPSIRGVARK
jgi:ubiquinone/menaquinone biosynthesis C-methylase UbiE